MPLFPKNAQEIVDAFAAAITPLTKIISISYLVIRTTGSKEAGTCDVRVSTPIYISTKEVDLVVEGVRTLMSHKT